MSKHALIEKLYEVPETLLNRVFGTFTDIPFPATEEDAIIAIGQLSANLNNLLLKPLSGLDIVELLLRVGQKNSTAIDSLLSGLEAIAGGGGKLKVIYPTNGSVLTDYAEPFACSGQGIQLVVVTMAGYEMELTADGDIWSGTLTDVPPVGAQTATFTATFQDESTATETVSFEVAESEIFVATFPENETAYASEDLTNVSVELSTDAAGKTATITFNVLGQTITLDKIGTSSWGKHLAEFNLDFVPGLQTSAFTRTGEDGTQTLDVSFNILGGE